MDTETAKRINRHEELDEHAICYWKNDGVWMLYLPRCGVGSLTNHTVAENSDGTITVTPSVLMDGHDKGTPMRRHGYLTGGVWQEV